MIRWKPTFEYSVHGTQLGINYDGEFDMEECTRIDNFSLPGRLRETDAIEYPGESHHVLLSLLETETATFSGQTTHETFSSVTQRCTKGFFRIGTGHNPELVRYVSIPDILKNPQYQTDEARYLVDLVPFNELDQFGVASLKKIIK